MAEAAKQQHGRMDMVRLSLAVLLVAAGIYGFYALADQLAVLRILVVLAGVIAAIAVTATTTQGKSVIAFIQGARRELRKVVWPTRAETLQATLIVFVAVVVIGLFLWLIDMAFFYAVAALIGLGG